MDGVAVLFTFHSLYWICRKAEQGQPKICLITTPEKQQQVMPAIKEGGKCCTFRNFKIFSPANSPCWGHVFGSEKFQKSEPERCFPPENLFQKSSIFSNISYRGVSWSDCLPRGVYIGMYKEHYYKMMTFENRPKV